jgi:hypothetical protein
MAEFGVTAVVLDDPVHGIRSLALADLLPLTFRAAHLGVASGALRSKRARQRSRHK